MKAFKGWFAKPLLLWRVQGLETKKNNKFILPYYWSKINRRVT